MACNTCSRIRRLLCYALLVAALVSSAIFLDWKYTATLLLGALTIMTVDSREFIGAALKTARRDLKGIKTLITMQLLLRRHLRKRSTVSSIFSGLVKQHPNKTAIIAADSGKEWSYLQVQQFSNQIASYFAAEDFREGDTVALFMQNCPEYLCLWLGMSKLGVVTALLNSNLRAEPLAHSIKIAKVKAIVCSSELAPALFETVASKLIDAVPIYVNGQFEATKVPKDLVVVKNFRDEIPSISVDPPYVQLKSTDFRSTLFYIYTSGTTGLPKAAIITHARFFMMARGVNESFDMTPDDRIYVTMPMYHSAAGILGVGQLLISGASIVVKPKFSASHFWEDCIRYNCTASQYIGEICRYLLAQPHRGTDSEHRVRLMYGNGLRPAIWEEFTARFRIAQIGEFYGSTEGNNNLLNMDNKVGSCGFLPIYTCLTRVYPVAIVKVDESTGEHIRDANGLCVRCKPGETGEIVGRIIKGDPVKDFKGYVSDNDTSKKIIQGVFVKGDRVFSSVSLGNLNEDFTGDILYMDELGYLYFKDRIGDTFRWKGENVSTCEVEAALLRAIGLKETNVYGVEIPGCEGRAGMAAIVGRNPAVDPNISELVKQLKLSLPAHARPVFLRLCKTVDTTGTYKLKKTEMQKQGFNPDLCGNDLLFYLNAKSEQYEPITAAVYADILSGTLKF